PAVRVERLLGRQKTALQRLVSAAREQLSRVEHRYELAARSLHSVSPLATLDRGYAIVADADTGRVLTDTKDVRPGTDVRAKLHRGEFVATVKSVTNDD
ncbi:MAG: exodeoxyribonuclease VII large subunit, partial [Gammaproteobacteria bacterium]|nr:exodeoxyribonuclease VII large subunit [Gammaproteobacteria bacterium]